MPYTNWVKKSWRKLEEDFLEASFKPKNESDLQAHLYHCMMENKPDRYINDKNLVLTTEYPVTIKARDGRITKKLIDIALLHGEEPRLLIEIKETGSNPSPGNVIKRIKNDISKLSDAMKLEGSPRTRKPIVAFFYREASNGITAETERSLEEKGKLLHKKIVFLYGPRTGAGAHV